MSSLNRMMRSNRMIRMLAADTRALDAEIDRRVSALHGLASEDIALVEGEGVNIIFIRRVVAGLISPSPQETLCKLSESRKS